MPQEDQISIREFLEFRMSSLEKKIDRNQETNERRIGELSEAIANLAKVIVSRETIDDLRAKVSEVDDLELRVVKLESQAGVVRWVMSGAWAVILALIIDKAKQLF